MKKLSFFLSKRKEKLNKERKKWIIYYLNHFLLTCDQEGGAQLHDYPHCHHYYQTTITDLMVFIVLSHSADAQERENQVKVEW